MDTIIRCAGEGCPMRDSCYRNSITEGNQWYGVHQNKGNVCTSFLPIPSVKTPKKDYPMQKVKNPQAIPKTKGAE